MLLGISGSLRKGSFNRKLVAEAARLYGGQWIEADLHFPLYNGDLEDTEGVPQSVQQLSRQIKDSEAVVISTPEYNQSLSGVLKNALDWVSRAEGSPWRGKPVAIMSAAAGRAGGARANYVLRLALNPFRPRLLTGPEVLVAGASKEFDDNGHLHGRYAETLNELMTELRRLARNST